MVTPKPFPNLGGYRSNAKTTTIPSGTALSAQLDLVGEAVASIIFPAAWTAADMTVLVSADGITFVSLYNMDGTEFTIKAAASKALIITPGMLGSFRYIQFRSGTLAVAVNQGADRVLTILT